MPQKLGPLGRGLIATIPCTSIPPGALPWTQAPISGEPDRPMSWTTSRPGLFGLLCAALSLESVARDDRFETNAARVAHRDAINEMVRSRTLTHTTDELLTLLRGAGVPCAPLRDIAQVSADEQTHASDMIVSGNGPTALKLPIRFEGVRPAEGAPPPRAGEHTAAVLSELGLS